MENLKTKKIILTLVIVLAIILGLTVSSFADEIQQINPSDIVGNNTSNVNTTNTNGVNTVNTANTTQINTVNTSNTNNSSSYNNTNLPSTGLKDYTPLFVIGGALVVIAIVAYKKANYYKNV